MESKSRKAASQAKRRRVEQGLATKQPGEREEGEEREDEDDDDESRGEGASSGVGAVDEEKLRKEENDVEFKLDEERMEETERL